MKYQLSTKLQSDGWEIEGHYDSQQEALDKAVKLCHGPLGYSCMYQICNENSKVTVDNKEIIDLAKRTPVHKCCCS